MLFDYSYNGDDFQSDFSNLSSGDEELSYSVYDAAEEYRQPLTETVINADHLTIQPINKSRLNTMEIEVINSYIYNFLNGRGLNNILNPNRKIPKEMRINSLRSCLLYTSPSPRDGLLSRMPSSA